MAIVQLNHPGVRMAEICGHHDQRRAVHDGMRRIMKIDRRVDLGPGAGLEHRAVLFGLLPLPTVGLRKDQVALALTGTGAFEKPATFVGQMHVVDLHAAVALPGGHTRFEENRLTLRALLPSETAQPDRKEIRFSGVLWARDSRGLAGSRS
jgi:hypothetical protein